MSILDQDSSGVVSIPSRAEVEAIPMPQLPNVAGSDNSGHFKSIAQFLQVQLPLLVAPNHHTSTAKCVRLDACCEKVNLGADRRTIAM